MNIWTESEDELLTQNYQLKKNDLLKLFPKRTAKAVNLRASYLGLKKIRNEYVKSSLDILLENNLESFYWIGFILADGAIVNNRLIITLSQKDILHLEKYCKYICSSILHKRRNGKYKICSTSCKDNYIIPKIVDKFNIKSRKTYNPPNIKYYDTFTDKQLKSIFIGLIDGDGCIKNQYKRRDYCLTIHSHSSWLEFYSYIKNRLNLSGNPYIDKAGYFSWCIGTQQILKDLKSFGLKHNLPLLERKWNIIL